MGRIDSKRSDGRKQTQGASPGSNIGLRRILYLLSSLVLGVLVILSLAKGDNLLTIVLLLVIVFNTFATTLTRTPSMTKRRGQDALPYNLFFFAAALLPGSTRDAAMGDSEEIYRMDLKRFGRRKATCLLCIDIIGSQYPKLKYLLLKAIALYELYRRFKG